ncbi:TonB-dependent receptor domain-containing protein [Pseudooceanicola sp. 200-1SW]|uniref:TonB-dependent receptor n=1 Tax=Pseudooceanicola sp. 200-1SW TaxID=3425949 RepID=UPI003D7F98DE
MTEDSSWRSEARVATLWRPSLRMLMLCTSAVIACVTLSGPTQAQTAAATNQQVELNIPAQPLGAALTRLADQTGVRLIIASSAVSGKRSMALEGSYSAESAFASVLLGSGLSHRFTDPNTVTISDHTASDQSDALSEGAILLDPIRVRGASDGEMGIYEMPGGAAYIGSEELEHYRGAGPADMFRGEPGVLSGEARNGAGSIDPNIRGLQGMGRVAATVDGAENSLLVYQGYQGVSNRSYVDPDFISEIEINKGADVASFANGGQIAMRTVRAEDIIKPGRNVGFRLKYELSGNTSSPVAGNRSGYDFTNRGGQVGTATPSPTGMDRPGTFEATDSAWSLLGAYKDEDVDFLLGFSHRDRGNYHAGENGSGAATPLWTGPREDCYSNGYCLPRPFLDYVVNDGIANYRAGEEVLNSQSESRSFLAKGGWNFGEGQRLELGYNRFRGRNGDVMASRQYGPQTSATQRERMTETDLDTVTLRYKWQPAETGLIDLDASIYWTQLEQRNAPRGMGHDPEDFGLPADFLPGSETQMLGASLSNTSQLDTGAGPLELTYGLRWKSEDTKPTPGTKEVEHWLDLRDARREEVVVFTKAEWEANHWLTVNAALRYQHYWSEDRNTDPVQPRPGYNYGVSRDAGGWGGSLGLTAQLARDWQIFASYSDTLRLPSIYESASAFSFSMNPDVEPERSRNWELGANFSRDGLLAPQDQAGFKLSYFNWTVDDYLGRVVTVDPTGPVPFWIEIDNIHEAQFAGIELAASYRRGGFKADVSANYYSKVAFCRTASTCESKSLYGDYATNQVPPEYSISLSASQSLMDDRLTLGGRVTHVGPRAIGHGDVTASGASNFISLVDWDPYTLVDVFAEYEVNDTVTARLRVDNLTDQFYIDPLGLTTQPGPGRTLYAGVTADF